MEYETSFDTPMKLSQNRDLVAMENKSIGDLRLVGQNMEYETSLQNTHHPNHTTGVSGTFLEIFSNLFV